MSAELFELLPDVVLFVGVARAKSFSQAAKLLRIPVSTLSRRIADFEAKLGVQLLVRSTRRVELTDSGARYFDRCQLIVDAAESAHAELRGEADHPRGTLRISVTQDFALIHLTPIFREFAERYPDISFELDMTARSVDLIAEGFDVALRMGTLPDSQLYARKLGSARMGIYAAPSYLEKTSPIEAPVDLASHDCLRILGTTDSTSHWSLSRDGKTESVEVKGRFVVNGMRFLLELATQGLGICVLDAVLAKPALDAGLLARILPDWRPPAVPVHALTASKLLVGRTRIFLDCLSDHLRIGGEAK